MISLFCLFWIGMEMHAPIWYFGIINFGIFMKVCWFISRVYDAGKDSRK